MAVRRYIGMVFQQPNPFSMSIFDNVAFGLRLNRFKGKVAERVEKALRRAALWDEVKDKLKKSGLSLSGGQQQRLCIARAVATEPAVLLMDEPCSALDPIATRRIEELMVELKQNYTIALVTHNMQQAQRVADTTAFFSVDISKGGRTGYLVEWGPRSRSSRAPASSLPGSTSPASSAEPHAAASRSALAAVLLRSPRAAAESRHGQGQGRPQGRGRDLPGAALQEVDPGLPAGRSRSGDQLRRRGQRRGPATLLGTYPSTSARATRR